MATPLALMLDWVSGCADMFKMRHPELPLPEDLPGLDVFWVIALPLYLLTGLAGGWWRFHRLPWHEGTVAPTIASTHPLARSIDRLLRLGLRRGPTAALVRKELRLHTAPWLVTL